jgi:hypothetical protein
MAEEKVQSLAHRHAMLQKETAVATRIFMPLPLGLSPGIPLFAVKSRPRHQNRT